ncbi:hypothetical protein [Pseudosulfitobacter sp. SM2401]|uniref:hypothetical protein n=1 Tax=Pseudosulfitobacter sp. SM2401 TaxID=3350098 RepID=UPI0036F33D9F
MFSDLPLDKFAVTYAKLFKILMFAGSKPRKRAIPVQKAVVPDFSTSVRFEPISTDAASSMNGRYAES